MSACHRSVGMEGCSTAADLQSP